MNERIEELALDAGLLNYVDNETPRRCFIHGHADLEEVEKFAELIVRECIDKIETYRIPVGNSAAGELACEWTYDALESIRDEIKEHFGVK
jgi:hypothetical protein